MPPFPARASGIASCRCSGIPSPARLPLVFLLGAAALVGFAGGAVRAQEQEAVEAAAAERVFVSGVDDAFAKVRQAVADAKVKSGRDYRVIVVGDAGGDRDAAVRLLDGLVERWRREAAEKGGKDAGAYDPSGDVTIVMDVKDRQIAVRAPWALEVSSGLDPATIKSELIDKVFVPRAKDGQYDEALADLVAATERWVQDRADRRLAQQEQTRVFRTRTLPIGLAALGGLGLATAFLVRRFRHERRVAEARRKLATFKEEVVALSDMLDSQQERHRMLPHTDPDFKTPMQGLTRSAYDDVQSAIRRYRERWLKLMDVWEKADEKIAGETFLGTSAADEAISLLDSAEARPPLADVAGECRAPLDALEQAHEKAREAATALDTSMAAVTARLEKLATRGRSAASFQPVMAEVARGAGLAKHELEADPVAARGRIEEHAAALDRASDRIDAVEKSDDRRRQAVATADEIARKVQVMRSEGWLLDEPGADPDERLAVSRREIDLAGQLLDAGEIDGGAAHLERAERSNAEARGLLESIVSARTKVDEMLPTCTARLEALAARREQTRRSLEQMAASYAEASWADVADNAAKADQGLERARSLLAETRAAADRTRQHYFRAVAVLDEAVRQEDWVEGLEAAVEDRRAEFDGLRASLPGRRDAVRGRVDRLERSLERQRTDRVRANERAREAGRLVSLADHGIEASRPDLRQVSQVLEAADTAAARGEEFAAEDERLARQAFEELEETDGLIRRVAAWYGEGVSPDVQPAVAAVESAKSLLTRQRYEDSLKASAEAARIARAAYAEATAEAERRRRLRLAQIQQRQLEESFARTTRGAGPWVIQLPGGVFSGPDPWRTMHGPAAGPAPSRSAESSWSSNTARGTW